MKTRIDDLIVVEGKTDIDFLSSFLDADFYSVNGSAVSEKDVNYLKKAKAKRNIIVITDPDFPGEKIRNYLNDNIEGLKNAYIDKSVSLKNNKVGVAESTQEEILKSLKNFVIYNKEKKSNTITYIDLYNLGLVGQENSKEKRLLVDQEYHTGHSNGKALLKKLNYLNVSKEDLERLLNVKRWRNYWFL